MSIAEKLTTIAENVNKVYEAGKTAGGGGNVEDSPFYYAEKLDAVFNNAVFPENYEAVIKLKKAPKQCCFLFYNALYYKSAKLISEDQTNIVNFEWSFLFGYHIEGKESLETVDLTEFNNKFSNIKMCFQLQSKLKNILGALDLSECSNVTNAFYRCNALENIEFVPNTIPISISFSSCSKLTHDSLMSIINGLKDLRATSYDLTDQAEDIVTSMFNEDYNGSFFVTTDNVNENDSYLSIWSPGGELRFIKSAFDESILNILKKVGNKIELDATATGDGANNFPCIINKLIVTDLADLPEEAHEITPLPDWAGGNPTGMSIYEEITTVNETETTITVYGESLGVQASFQKTKYTDEILSLLKEGNIISCTSTYMEDGTTIITACTIYKKMGFQTLTLGTTNLNKLTDEEKAIATEKGWTLV